MKQFFWWNIILGFFVLVKIPGYAQSLEKNYIKTIIPQVPVTDTSALNQLPGKQKSISYDFYDGLGRTIQTLAIESSPSGNDLVECYDYDLSGRQIREYLPFPASPSKGSYLEDAIVKQKAFYLDPGDHVTATGFPFADRAYDDSPLHEIIRQGFPGNIWQLNSGHVQSNESYGNTSEVTQWVFNAEGECAINGTYPAGCLLVSEYRDENGTIGRSYYNASGHLILNEYMLGSRSVQTHYVYDEQDRLRVVIPPEASAKSVADTGLIYRYHYDNRGRLIQKCIPGAMAILMVYDQMDRLVLKQDGHMRNDSLWLFNKYDAFGRIVISGLYQSHLSHHDLQSIVMSQPSSYEITDGTDYTNRAFPTEDIIILTRNYYDDYRFLSITNLEYQDPLFSIVSSGPEVILPEIVRSIKNRRTGSTHRIMGTDLWITSVTYFDKYGKILQEVAQNHLGGIDRTSYQYDFNGRVLNQKTEHSNRKDWLLVIEEKFTYDHAGRLLQVFIRVNDDPTVILSGHQYNELGQLVQKQLHSDDGGSRFVETIRYAYNTRGWMTRINNPDLPEEELFALRLDYENPETVLSNTPQYNGNVSSMVWTSSDQNTIRGYGFAFDDLDRLTNARYGIFTNEWNLNDENYSVPFIGYDLQGNIDTLVRMGQIDEGHFGIVDNLKYHYQGNHLTDVDDDGMDGVDELDFMDSGSRKSEALTDPEYRYDANGNLISDANKGIVNIHYNILNLPEEIWYEDNRIIRHTYHAGGVKIKTEVFDNWGFPVKILDYCGPVYYTNLEIDFIATREGRILADSNTFHYEYILKDHLGNARVHFRITDARPQVIQEYQYYPFGTPIFYESGMADLNPEERRQRYLYNGKEFYFDFGLNWYDYGARFYDPQLGRWWLPDSKAEDAPGWSPYRYGLNNPIRYIDPDGQWEDWYQSESGALAWKDRNEDKLTLHGEIYENIGKTVSLQTGEGYVNYYENVPISISENPANAALTIQKNVDLENQLLSDESPLSLRARTDLFQASIHHATGQAASVIFEAGMMAAPMPKIGMGAKTMARYAPRMYGYLSKTLNSAYIRGGVRANLYIDIAKKELIKDVSFFWHKSTYSTKKKMAKTGIPRILRNSYKKNTNIFFDPTYQNFAVDILGNILTR